MKLDPDCVRDILLAVEEATDATSSFEYERSDPVPKRLKNYDHNTIQYHFQQCDMAGLIVGFKRYDAGEHITINDLSPEGHKFIANIREDNIWNGIKNIALKVGSKSLDAIIQIASNVITELIKAQFGLSSTSRF